jgi:hypothetical protein
MSIQLDSLSPEAQADVAKVLGTAPPPESTPEEAAAESEPALESNPEEETDVSESNVPDEESEDDSSDTDSESSESQTEEADIEYIKANGKKVKIDFNDRDNIKRVYSLAAGARQWQAERDSLKSSNDELNGKYTKLKETMDYLESIKDDHEDIFEAVTGIKLSDKFQQWAEEQNMINGMTEAEKAMYLSNQDHQKRIRDVEKRERELQAKLDEAAKRDEEAKDAKQSSLANPIFFKYNFDGELEDAQLERRMNKALWSEAREELSAYDDVTPDMIEETFKRISNQIRGGFKSKSEKVVKKVVKNNRKAVKAKAQKMAVSEPVDDRKRELEDKIKSNDIAGILAGDFGDLLKSY